MSDRPLYTIRESRSISRDLWQRFTDKARAEWQMPPGPALGRLMRQFLGDPDDDASNQQPK